MVRRQTVALHAGVAIGDSRSAGEVAESGLALRCGCGAGFRPGTGRTTWHGNCLASLKCQLSAVLDTQTVVFPSADPALTVVCLIQYTCQPLTYDKTAIFRSEKIVLPKWQNAV